jgi:hypothetical protein
MFQDSVVVSHERGVWRAGEGDKLKTGGGGGRSVSGGSFLVVRGETGQLGDL